MNEGRYVVEVTEGSPGRACVRVIRRSNHNDLGIAMAVASSYVGETRREWRLRRLVRKAQREADRLNAGLADAYRRIKYGEHLARTGQEKRQ